MFISFPVCRILFRFSLGALLASLAMPAICAEDIVIGQSLPLSGSGFVTSNRILAGAKTYIDAVNAAGGIGGRQLRLLTLDDADNPQRLAENLRRLIDEEKAVAILNCVGDAACRRTAALTSARRIPLIGPLSGANELRSAKASLVYSVRPAYDREADALARQLRSLGISKVALLSDATTEQERKQALNHALAQQKIHVVEFAVAGNDASLDNALKEIGAGQYHALVLDLGFATSDALGQRTERTQAGIPAILATLSSGTLTQLIKSIRDRSVGYTAVVPNPESSSPAIVRELQRNAERYGNPEAVTFEGMESYIHACLCVEALRRAGAVPSAARLISVLDSMDKVDLGGFQLTFGRVPRNASDYVEIGLRSRSGELLK